LHALLQPCAVRPRMRILVAEPSTRKNLLAIRAISTGIPNCSHQRIANGASTSLRTVHGHRWHSHANHPHMANDDPIGSAQSHLIGSRRQRGHALDVHHSFRLGLPFHHLSPRHVQYLHTDWHTGAPQGPKADEKVIPYRVWPSPQHLPIRAGSQYHYREGTPSPIDIELIQSIIHHICG